MLVLVNPLASRVRGGRGCADLELVAREAGARLLYPQGVGALDEVVEKYLAGLGSTDEGRVCLVGGDGTLHRGATALHRALRGRPWPAVGLIPAGTVNTTAAQWGARGSPAAALRSALASGARRTQRASLRLVVDGGEEHLGFIWGAGLVARFFERYDATGGGVGPAARLALRVAAGALAGSALAAEVLASSPMNLTIDGRPVARERYSLAVVSVHRSVGLGIRVTYRAGQEGKLHLVASGDTPSGLGRKAPRVLLGAPLGGQTVDELAGEISIEFPDKSATILDGDRLDARRLALTPGPWLPVVG